MVRGYDPARPLDRGSVDRLIDLALRAPSAGFTQGSHFLVLDDAADRTAFWTTTTDPATPADEWLTGLQTAPVLLMVCSERAAYERRYARPDKAGLGRPATLEDRWPVPYWDVDAGMAALLILLGAVDAGLGACLFGVPTERVASVRTRFGLPATFVPVGMVSLGYPMRAEPAQPDRYRPGRATGARTRPRRRPRAEQVSYGRFGLQAPVG